MRRCILCAGSLPVISGTLPLQQELLRLLATAPFWNKDLDWLQSRAAVQALLPRAATGSDFARLLWLIEELLYEDLLKGSGWGRRRGWFREQLEAVHNIAQVRGCTDAEVLHSRARLIWTAALGSTQHCSGTLKYVTVPSIHMSEAGIRGSLTQYINIVQVCYSIGSNPPVFW